MTTDISAEFGKMFEDLRKAHEEARPVLQPDEFTTVMYAQANGMTQKQSENEIAAMVRTGRFTRMPGKRYADGRLVTAYRLAEKG